MDLSFCCKGYACPDEIQLQGTVVPIIDDDTCSNYLGGLFFREYMICVFDGSGGHIVPCIVSLITSGLSELM